MRIPAVKGVIARRILANYRVDPEVLRSMLPAPFRPQIVEGKGIAGICLIRLENIRPKALPVPFGLSSENAAHRIAVEWDGGGHGVYIPRRDSSSILNALAGGRVFPGLHHKATFEVREEGDRYHVALQSDDGQTRVVVEGRAVSEFPPGSVFGSLAEASAFFERGSLGYSVTATPGCYDGLELRSQSWTVEPLAVERIESSYFAAFPAGSVEFDGALLMRNIDHEWHGRGVLTAPSAPPAEAPGSPE